MRKLHLAGQLQDAPAFCGLVLGLPMLGQAAPARGLPKRYHPREALVGNWEADRIERDVRVLEFIRSSNDMSLDEAAYTKSSDEAK